MGNKKRKVQHQEFEVVVEESREPAAYTIGQQKHEQQQQPAKRQQQQQAAPHENGHHHAAADDAGAYPPAPAAYDGAGGYDDYGGYDEGRPQLYHHAGAPGVSRIDPDTLSYLTEVCEALSGMSDPAEAELLRSNVLEEIAGKELSLATDAASASLLEQLLSGAPAAQLMQFMQPFTEGELLWRLAGGAFGSHVAEKVLAWLHAAAKAAAAADADDAAAQAGVEGLEPLLDALVSAVEPHIVDYATDRHATHVARALLVVLAGRDVLTPPGKKERQRRQHGGGGGGGEGEEGQAAQQHQQQGYQQQKAGVLFGQQRSSLAEKISGSGAAAAAAASSARFPLLLRRLVKALPLFDPTQMSSLGKNTYCGPLLQAMLRAAAQDEPLLMLLLPAVLGLDPTKAAAAAPGHRLATLTDSHISRLLRDDCYSHLLEVAVAVLPQTATAAATAEGAAAEGGDAAEPAAAGGSGGASLAEEFYERFLRGRLLQLACHHCANFVIQAALSAAYKQPVVAAYVSELSPHLADLLRRRRSGVVAALAAAAARAGPGPHQQQLVAAVAAALGKLPQWEGRAGTAHLAPALMTLDTQAVLGSASGSSGSTTRLSTPGCAMLSLLLSQFPALVVAPFWQSVGALAPGDVLRVAKDPSGSRMLEAALVVAAAAAEAPLSKKKLRKLKKQQKAGAAAAAGDSGDEAAAAGGSGDAAAAAATAARAALLSKLRGSWGAIAQVPSGSFLLEAVYNSLPPEEAEVLVSEVAAAHDQLLSRCSWGPLLAKKLGLEAYLRSPEEWRKRAAAAAAARREFQTLLASTTAGKRSSKPSAAQQQSQQQEQEQPPAADAGEASKKGKKKRSREQPADADADADADAAAVDSSNARKRARLAAAALAAAEAVDGDAVAAGDKKKQKKQQKKRKRPEQAEDAAAAGGGSESKSAKRSKKEEGRSKKKRGRDSAGGAGEDSVLDLLSFGGLQQSENKKQRKR